MYLKELRLKNYQSHAETVLTDIPPVTVLMGPNGSGKSALFEGLRVFSRILSSPVSQAFGVPPYSFADMLFRGATRQEMGFEAVLVAPQLSAEVRVSIQIGYSGAETVGAPPSILNETVSIDGKCIFDRAAGRVEVESIAPSDLTPHLSLFAIIRGQSKVSRYRGPLVLQQLAAQVGRVVRYRLEPRQMSYPSPDYDTAAPVRIGYEGDNLASVLHWLKENSPESLAKIVQDVRTVVPGLEDIKFNYVGGDRIGFSLEFSDARQTVLAANASSGTILLLGLVTLLHGPTQPDIACIEEPETGLTPDAVRLFLRLLVDHASTNGLRTRSQFMFSSHSPFVLVDAWNSNADDRSFIKRTRIHAGRTVMENVENVLTSGEIHLQKVKSGQRAILGLKAAEEVMCGRFLPSE
jgi:predicted ATPase